VRLKLLRRRLFNPSLPRLAVRSHLAWPLRWALIALVFGFCAAIGLWAFEFGKAIAGVDGDARDELQKARAEIAQLQTQLVATIAAREKAQTVADTSSTLVTAERTASEKLVSQNKLLEAEIRQLKDDLGFYEKLMPASGADGVAVRALHAEVQAASRQVKWQVLLTQASKAAPDFAGTLEVSFAGTQNGKPWTASLPGGAREVKFRQIGRVEGMFELPEQTVLKSVSVKVLEGKQIKAVQTAKV
jgi:hypothetical protein